MGGQNNKNGGIKIMKEFIEFTECEMENYKNYRGKCKKYCEDLIKEDPSLRLVRGHYYCPLWGEQAHWWVEDKEGNIIDPTKDQFPSKGMGEYIEFSGIVYCEVCGKEMKEEEATWMSRFPVCNDNDWCARTLVGV